MPCKTPCNYVKQECHLYLYVDIWLPQFFSQSEKCQIGHFSLCTDACVNKLSEKCSIRVSLFLLQVL